MKPGGSTSSGDRLVVPAGGTIATSLAFASVPGVRIEPGALAGVEGPLGTMMLLVLVRCGNSGLERRVGPWPGLAAGAPGTAGAGTGEVGTAAGGTWAHRPALVSSKTRRMLFTKGMRFIWRLWWRE